MVCPAAEKKPHRNLAKGDPGSKLAGCLLRKQMKEYTSAYWHSVSYGMLQFLELIAGWCLGRRDVGNRFCWKCRLQRSGSTETSISFSSVNIPRIPWNRYWEGKVGST